MLQRLSSELENPRAVAVIPARGGSKGISRKNLQQVAGQTLVARAIEICQCTERLSAVYVSTDDREIGMEAERHHAGVIPRPPHLAHDRASTADVLLHAAGALRATQVLVLVQCTAPLLMAADIDGTIDRLLETDADTAIAVAPSHDWLCRVGYDGRLRGIGWELPDQTRRRQDMLPQYALAGSVWAIDLLRFLERRTIYSDNCVAYEVEQKLDIDWPSDLELARAMCNRGAPVAEEVYYPH